jgi:hypothetical protein
LVTGTGVVQGRGEIDSTVKKHAKDPVMAK